MPWELSSDYVAGIRDNGLAPRWRWRAAGPDRRPDRRPVRHVSEPPAQEREPVSEEETADEE